MAVLGFTTVGSLLKEQSDKVAAKGIEAFGVTVIDDSDGKHDPIGSSNAQLHLFMQLKRENVTHMLFQSSEQADIFISNMERYYGKEKADGFLSKVEIMTTGDASAYFSARGKESKQFTSFDDVLSVL